MLPEFANSWWPLLLRGICAILFGVMAFIWPGLSLLTLVFLYGAYALVDGVFALWPVLGGAALLFGVVNGLIVARLLAENSSHD